MRGRGVSDDESCGHEKDLFFDGNKVGEVCFVPPPSLVLSVRERSNSMVIHVRLRCILVSSSQVEAPVRFGGALDM